MLAGNLGVTFTSELRFKRFKFLWKDKKMCYNFAVLSSGKFAMNQSRIEVQQHGASVLSRNKRKQSSKAIDNLVPEADLEKLQEEIYVY